MMDWMIGTGIAVTLLIALVLLIRKPFARFFGARAAYALWVLPVIRLIMPEVTIPRILPQALSDAATAVPVLPNDLTITPEMITALQAGPSLMDIISPYMLPALLTVWAIGALTFFLSHWLRQAVLMDHLTYVSKPAHKLRYEIIAAAQAVGLKTLPDVRISDEKAGPLVAGCIRPIVILPDNFTANFSPTQRHYALMHEFMHIRRGDVWVAMAGLCFRAINWPNPLVHYAARHFRSDQEAACDASVLNALEAEPGPHTDTVSGYAETLIHAAKSAMTDGRASPQSSGLALTIHHPLKERLMILGTHRRSNWRTRTAAAVMIIGAATLSAPLIQADAHPEEKLAGKYETHQGKSVIKRKVRVDGKTVSEHFEINVDGDDVKAYKVGPFGEKTRIDIEDIEGVDIADVLEEKIEGDIKRTVTISDDDGVKVMSRDDFKKWAETEYPAWKENDFASWVDGDMSAWVAKMNDGNSRLVFNNFPHPPKPPALPRFSKHSDNVFVLESDDLEDLESLELLQSLEGLEKLKDLSKLKSLEGLKGLEALKNLDNFDIRTYAMDDPEHEIRFKLRMTESKLAAARSILEGTEVEASDSREMAKAKRELEKARKALKAAEKVLKEAK